VFSLQPLQWQLVTRHEQMSSENGLRVSWALQDKWSEAPHCLSNC
jgi:hypothetical protein